MAADRILIGLTGAAGSGKDTVADYLVGGFGFHRLAFAAPLKREAAAAFGITGDALAWLEDRENKERPLLRLALQFCNDPGFIRCVTSRDGTGQEQIAELYARRSWRWILQRWGTEYRRAQKESYWIDRAAEAAINRDRVVFTDTRFHNEVEFIRRWGGVLWHIRRPGIAAVEAHVSNQELDVQPEDAIILNDGSIPDLARNIQLYMGDKYAAYRIGR